ncbi:MAG: LacI family transcriptional regulator [Sulfobacillus acidophilus]|uniref:LacI family transcriptional regulator n=1 Tax=Sulfobacillus acidophilus TaxID=53633 RepID=A0A2T2WDA5_9FIRM|nr:MAG: LacI family transcriptional regulator [Sulfobacillus acidophilus]
MPTIRDVARQAGVGVGTVSRYFNGGYVSEKNRQRILSAIRDLDYRLNEVARTLSTGRSWSIGLIIPDLLNPFYPILIHGVEDVCKSVGVAVILVHTAEDVTSLPRLLRSVEQRGVDAIVCAAGKVDPGATAIPLIMVDRVGQQTSFDAVSTDHMEGGRLAARYLISRGHSRILFLSVALENVGVELRWQGFRDALEEQGITPMTVAGQRMDFQHGYHLARAAIRDLRPTAVFAANDLMALGVIRAATESGLRVPEDLSVIGFDGIDLSDYVTPPLTTVAQPIYELGVHAARLALSRAYEGNNGPNQKLKLPPQLIVRGSG